jgi:hypothetical protein
MLTHIGFQEKNIELKNLYLPENIEQISKDIIASAESQKKSPTEIELINLFYAKK